MHLVYLPFVTLLVILKAVAGHTPADWSMAARAPRTSPWAQNPLTIFRLACLLLKMLITVWCFANSCVISSVSEPPNMVCPYIGRVKDLDHTVSWWSCCAPTYAETPGDET